MKKRWVGFGAAIAGGVLAIWAVQAIYEQKRLARELIITQSAFSQAKAENTSLKTQLAQLQADVERAQVQQAQLTSQLSTLEAQLTKTADARERAETQLLALQEQERLWRAEKVLLEERLVILRQEKSALEQRIGVSSEGRQPQATPRQSPSRRTIPPTAGSSEPAGNKGYLVRDGAPTESESSTRVQVLPATN